MRLTQEKVGKGFKMYNIYIDNQKICSPYLQSSSNIKLEETFSIIPY